MFGWSNAWSRCRIRIWTLLLKTQNKNNNTKPKICFYIRFIHFPFIVYTHVTSSFSSTRNRDRFLSNCRIRSLEKESSVEISCGMGNTQSRPCDGTLGPATDADMSCGKLLPCDFIYFSFFSFEEKKVRSLTAVKEKYRKKGKKWGKRKWKKKKVKEGEKKTNKKGKTKIEKRVFFIYLFIYSTIYVCVCCKLTCCWRCFCITFAKQKNFAQLTFTKMCPGFSDTPVKPMIFAFFAIRHIKQS